MINQEQDVSRYYLEDVHEAIEGKYSATQLKIVLNEFGYDFFPDNGINDKGFRKIMRRIAEIDRAQANLERVRTMKRRGMRNLDSEIKGIEKPERVDWKQWVPVYGIYKAYKDNHNGKPSLTDGSHPNRYILSSVYHGVTSFCSMFGFASLLEKLLK